MKIVAPADAIPDIASGSIVACPGCDAALEYGGCAKSDVDECGFESYRFRCGTCGAMVVGIVDPADQTLLLTIVP
jgi:hypothetical protein